jgi:hypothetical protein
LRSEATKWPRAHQAARRMRPWRASRLPDGSRTVRRPRWGCRVHPADPSAGPSRPAARPRPPSSGARTLASALLLPSQFPLLAQSHLEEHQEHSGAKTDGDQRDGEHFAGQPADQDRADRTSDNERGGRSKRQDALAGRHHPKVSLRSGALGTRVPLVTAQRINVTNRDPERDNHAVCSGPGGLAGRCGGGQ